MSADPYRPPAGRVADPPGEEFRLVRALVGGAAGIGAAYTAGVIVSPLFQFWYVGQSVAVDDLYHVIMMSFPVNAVGQVLSGAGEALGGLLAAQLGGTKPFAHAAASATVAYVAVSVQYLGFFPSPFPVWSQLLDFVLPLPCALLGAWLYAVRNIRL